MDSRFRIRRVSLISAPTLDVFRRHFPSPVKEALKIEVGYKEALIQHPKRGATSWPRVCEGGGRSG